MLTKRLHATGAIAIAVSLSTLMLGQAAMAELGEEGASGWRRAEVPLAGLSLDIPAAWDDGLVTDPRPQELVLPEEYGTSFATSSVLYNAYTFDASSATWCELAEYQDMPLPLQEHAEWHEHLVATTPGFTGLTYSQPFDLPIGEAIRVDSGYLDGEQHIRYLFDHGDVRYHFDCEADSSVMAEDGWLEIAMSIQPIAGTSSTQGEPEAFAPSIDTKSVTGYWDYAYVVPPSDPSFPVASVMWAWCDIATWMEADDGSATEWVACTLTDEPYEPADQQGVPPGEVVSLSGGPCDWWSGYWWQVEGRRVYASSYMTTVTPDGLVFSRAEFPAEPLECDG